MLRGISRRPDPSLPRYARRTVPRLLVVAAGVAATGTMATGAAFACGSTVLSPSPADARAISAAVRTSPLTAEVPAKDYTVTGAKLAAADPSWAWVELHPSVPDVDRVEAVLQRVHHRWQVKELGSFEVGCDLAPAHVLRDFGIACPPTLPPGVAHA